VKNLFSFENVNVAIEGTKVLGDVSLRIPTGHLTVIAGASGSGKTSLLRLCNRLDVPTSGTVRFRGSDLAGLDPLSLRRRVGMVFQQPVLFGGTVADNLHVAAPDAGADQLKTALAEVELGAEFLARIGDDLSGGEAQRVCLARALLCEPEVLLMDEPTAALHPAARRSLEKTVQTLQQDSNVDVVWVTHDMDQISRMANHLVVLADGNVLYAGPADSAEADAALATLAEEVN
jgi:putative ABC transport system ATP-binding protein